jgi:hypothetical protein
VSRSHGLTDTDTGSTVTRVSTLDGHGRWMLINTASEAHMDRETNDIAETTKTDRGTSLRFATTITDALVSDAVALQNAVYTMSRFRLERQSRCVTLSTRTPRKAVPHTRQTVSCPCSSICTKHLWCSPIWTQAHRLASSQGSKQT